LIVDLHAHYAMHLIPQATGTPIDMLSTARGRGRLRDRIRARSDTTEAVERAVAALARRGVAYSGYALRVLRAGWGS
jgi:hypothetical protein